MEEKKITEKESIELIVRMLSDTRSRLEVGDGNVLLNWGVLTVLVAVAVWVTSVVTHSTYSNLLWSLMAFGWLFNRRHAVSQRRRGCKSYTDKVCSTIWSAVGIIGIVAAAMCGLFHYATGVSPWFVMYLYALMVVGGATMASGVVLKVGSMVWGGSFSIAVGLGLVCCVLTGVAIRAIWLMPVFILCFGVMMVLPGLELRRKTRIDHEGA